MSLNKLTNNKLKNNNTLTSTRNLLSVYGKLSEAKLCLGARVMPENMIWRRGKENIKFCFRIDGMPLPHCRQWPYDRDPCLSVTLMFWSSVPRFLKILPQIKRTRKYSNVIHLCDVCISNPGVTLTFNRCRYTTCFECCFKGWGGRWTLVPGICSLKTP